MTDAEREELRDVLARAMPRPQIRGVGLMIPKGVDPATLKLPEPTPLDGDEAEAPDSTATPDRAG